MSTTRRENWFATLRRDRGAFALLGALLLVLNLIQPLVAAQAGEGGHMVICTLSGAQEAGEPLGIPSESCPVCLIGNACPNAAPAGKAALSDGPAFCALSVLAATIEAGFATLPALRSGSPPPAIRAPPASA